jgi:hypothetical protein
MQIVDNIAKYGTDQPGKDTCGKDILVFALEMGRSELMARF